MELGTKKILVTGAAGWLGQSLLHALACGLPGYERFREPDSGLTVRGLLLPEQQLFARTLRELPAGSLTFASGDVRRPADCERFCEDARGATVFHTAAVIHPRRVREFYEVNVDGTRNMLDAAARAGVLRFVHVSSNSPCGCNPSPAHLFNEDSPYHPYMNYGRSKMLAEEAVRQFQATGGMETVIVRAPWFYGPRQPARQTLFFRMIRDGRAPIAGSGDNRRSMVYVDNLAYGLLLAATTPQAAGRTYWIADQRPYTMNEIVDTVEILLEKEFGQRCAHRRLRLPKLASTVAYAADGLLQAAGLYHQKIHVLSEMDKNIACSIARATAELGYVPAVALEEGMRRSLKWCSEEGLLP